MVDYKNCSLQDLVDMAREEGHISYLKTLAEKTYKTEDGKKRKISFFEIKKAYYTKYHEDALPVAKTKKKTMYDILAELED